MEKISYYEICEEMYKYEQMFEKIRKEYTQIAFRMSEFGFNHFADIGNGDLLNFVFEMAQERDVIKSQQDNSLYEYLVSIGRSPTSNEQINEIAIQMIKELLELKRIIDRSYYGREG